MFQHETNETEAALSALTISLTTLHLLMETTQPSLQILRWLRAACQEAGEKRKQCKCFEVRDIWLFVATKRAGKYTEILKVDRLNCKSKLKKQVRT